MKTSAHEDRLLVVSDVHLGNRLFPIQRQLAGFLRYAYSHRYSICINGDGIDIVQLSPARLTRALAESYKELRHFAEAGLKVYYVVGNHDIIVEHFLEDWGSIVAVPFLNLTSGETRIRVDHGHMYDEMFLKYPRIYTAVTMIGRWAISLSPEFYERMEVLNHALVGLGRKVAELGKKKEPEGQGIPGEHPSFRKAAQEVSLRGFDAVIFGHTHHPGWMTLPSGAAYYNTGSWLHKPHCVAIDHGRIWFGQVSDLLEGKARFAESIALRDEQVRALAGTAGQGAALLTRGAEARDRA